ncbi:MAG: helix-turn-helix domain-containing protein [Acholeplasmataceae bacterium]|nr:helix-turn-helix domain-containing protein [Acholeplasmataceae bacterium]
MLNLKVIGKKIEKHRKEKNMTQYELADALYVTHQAVSKWEKGKSIPSLEVLLLLTNLFHITIDYLLDDVEIKRDDYASLLNNYSRETAINKFVQSKDPSEDIHKIFYLLQSSERKFIINLLVSKKLNLEIPVLWTLLSIEERKYLLGIILSNKYDYDLSTISFQLSHEEQMMCYQHKETYRYPLQFTYNYRNRIRK